MGEGGRGGRKDLYSSVHSFVVSAQEIEFPPPSSSDVTLMRWRYNARFITFPPQLRPLGVSGI